ncbi:MAG: ribosomal-protein-alanine N-acetyltransferase [Pseudomonadota bacterium]|jgi:ribosomal-protein-alanine N-acetyltransferase
MFNVRLLPMAVRDLDEVIEVESLSHQSTWTKGNFVDSLNAGYWAYCLRRLAEDDDDPDELIAYCVLLPSVNELELLNITVHPDYRKKGYAHKILEIMEDLALSRSMESIFLEVRYGNQPAKNLYQKFGFEQVGLRKDYYPLISGGREDAIIMKKTLIKL